MYYEKSLSVSNDGGKSAAVSDNEKLAATVTDDEQSAAVSYDKLQAAPDDENSAAVSDDDQSSALITESECSEIYLKLMKSNLTVAEKIGTFFVEKSKTPIDAEAIYTSRVTYGATERWSEGRGRLWRCFVCIFNNSLLSYF